MKKYLETFQKYFYSNFPYFIQVPIKLIISSLVIRIFEAISIKYFSTSTDSVIKYSVQGFFYDIPLVLKWAVYYLPFFLILFYFSKKAARIVTNSILLVFIV